MHRLCGAFHEDTPLELISLLKPDILVKGVDLPGSRGRYGNWLSHTAAGLS
jgi:hypothetical protein